MAREQLNARTSIPDLETRCPACHGTLRSDDRPRRTVVIHEGSRRLRAFRDVVGGEVVPARPANSDG